jgi:hypothetical protein
MSKIVIQRTQLLQLRCEYSQHTPFLHQESSHYVLMSGITPIQRYGMEIAQHAP